MNKQLNRLIQNLKNISVVAGTLIIVSMVLICHGRKPNEKIPIDSISKTGEWQTYRNEKFGFEFEYSHDFVVGKYKEEIHPPLEKGIGVEFKELGIDPEEFERPFKNMIVLVEKRLIGNIPVSEIPIGEISAITIHPHIGKMVEFYNKQFNKKEFHINIGNYTVVKLPGYPGPYGKKVFYYLLPLSDEIVIEFYAHKERFKFHKHSKDKSMETKYDIIIEKIISTFKFINKNQHN